MARLGTPNLGLGTWLDNENPGAGSQTVPNTGLNGNWLTIDTSLGLQHNADGTHKANIIKGSNLVQIGGDSCVDGSTLEFNSNKIRAKDGGLTGIKCNQTAGQFVDGSTLEFNANAIRVKPLGIGTSQIADDAITGEKISNNNNSRKDVFCLDWSGTDGRISGTALSTTVGIVMLRDGCVTGFSICLAGGTIRTNTAIYSSSDVNRHFTAGQAISIGNVSGLIGVYKHGNTPPSGFAISVIDSGLAANSIITIEVEYDN